MESVKRVWNGDIDLNDGELQKLRSNYECLLAEVDRFRDYSGAQSLQTTGSNLVNMFNEDIPYLVDGLNAARITYQEKFQKKVPDQTLKDLNWDIVEFNTLIQQAQLLRNSVVEIIDSIDEDEADQLRNVRIPLTRLDGEIKRYLSAVFKKKRSAASHVLVTMLSDEKRERKPYAIPVRFIAYGSMKDQYIRDFNKQLKEKMVESGLKLVGTVTDGEFCSLRSQGETRPLHIWQIIHDAKEAVRKMSKTTLLKMLVKIGGV